MATKNTNLNDVASKIKSLSIDMSYKSKTGHLGSALSISDILTVLYFKVMNIDPKKPKDPKRDRFILSKGHGVASLYATLALRGFFPIEELDKYRTTGGRFHGHPCFESTEGIEVSSGSLGHGLSIGAGMALSLKQLGKKSKVYVLMGDGECQEGSVWEAAMFSFTHKLNNLIAIVDANGFQGFGKTKEIQSRPLASMWRGFGWKVINCNGHDTVSITKSLLTAQKSTTPSIIIAKTISGKGVPLIANSLRAHYHILKDDEYQKVVANRR